MSTPTDIANLYKNYLKRKDEISTIKKALNDELKGYQDELLKLTLDLDQGDLFTDDITQHGINQVKKDIHDRLQDR